MSTALNHKLKDGIVAAQAQQFDKARALLQPLTKSRPNDPLVWFWLAIAAPSIGNAIPCLRKVLEIDANHAQARAALAKLLVAQSAAFAAAGKRDEARSFADEAATLTPDIDSVWLAVAAVSDRWPVRLESLRRAFALNPAPATRTKLRQALLYQATMLTNSERAEARMLFRESAELDPSDIRVWQALAQLADTPAEALSAARELLKLSPDHSNGRTFLKQALAADARALDVAGESVEARNRWREVLSFDSRDVEAWLGLAQTTKDDDEAQKAVEMAYNVNPTDERVVAAMARLQNSGLDPAAFEAPIDAFARLDKSEDMFARLDSGGDPFAHFELSDDPFAKFAPAPKVEPVAAAATVDMPVAEPLQETELLIATESEPAVEVTPELIIEAAPQPAVETTPELAVEAAPRAEEAAPLVELAFESSVEVAVEPAGETAVEAMQIVGPHPAAIERVGNEPVLVLDGRTHPLRDLADTLGLPRTTDAPGVRGIRGATLLGDGIVVLILNATDLAGAADEACRPRETGF
jgi:tetratricopeptide (TPR) repeat protein